MAVTLSYEGDMPRFILEPTFERLAGDYKGDTAGWCVEIVWRDDNGLPTMTTEGIVTAYDRTEEAVTILPYDFDKDAPTGEPAVVICLDNVAEINIP